MASYKAQKKDKIKIKLEDLLKAHPDGLTIKEMMDKTGLARHTILARLHNLEGQDKISVRQINMAKLHRWKHENEPLKEKKPDDVPIVFSMLFSFNPRSSFLVPVFMITNFTLITSKISKFSGFNYLIQGTFSTEPVSRDSFK